MSLLDAKVTGLHLAFLILIPSRGPRETRSESIVKIQDYAHKP